MTYSIWVSDNLVVIHECRLKNGVGSLLRVNCSWLLLPIAGGLIKYCGRLEFHFSDCAGDKN